MFNFRFLCIFLLAISALSFVACSNSSEAKEISKTTSATVSAIQSATPTPTMEIATPTPNFETSWPLSIKDALGQELIFDGVPQKIATISPMATEMLYAIGGSASLRDRASNYPIEAQDIPDVGSAYEPSIETIVANQPDLVIIESITQARFAGILSQAGIKVMAVKVESIEDLTTYLTLLGKIIDKQKVSADVIDDIDERLSTAKMTDTPTSILILIGDRDRNLYAARPESYTGLIASTLGLDNKAAGLPDSAPYPGFALMSTESLYKANPDMIVTITPAPEPAPRLSDSIKEIPPFAGLKAIRKNNVIEADVSLFLQSPGPRIVDAVEFLKDALPAE